MNRTWQSNADEFKELDAGEGWAFAVLVACSVEKGRGNGAHRSLANRQGKASAAEFAERCGTSPHRVLRYLDAWERAVTLYGVEPAVNLAPDDAPTVSIPEVPWQDANVYDARRAGGRPRDSRPEDAATIIERRGAAAVVAELTLQHKEAMLDELLDHKIANTRDTPAAHAARVENNRTVSHDSERAWEESTQLRAVAAVNYFGQRLNDSDIEFLRKLRQQIDSYLLPVGAADDLTPEQFLS